MNSNNSRIKISKPMLHRVRELHRKKLRQERNSFILEGPKLLAEALRTKIEIMEIYARGQWFDDHSSELPENVTCVEVNDEELGRISTLINPNEVLAVAAIPEVMHAPLPDKGNMILYLDAINDPGNLGTIIRLADWFGLSGVVLGPGSVDPFNPKVVQGSMGSLFRVGIFHSTSEAYLSACKEAGVEILGADMNGENIYEAKLGKGGVVVMGSESHGLSESCRSYIDKIVSIPSFSVDHQVESLNVSMAAAIICSEFRAGKR